MTEQEKQATLRRELYHELTGRVLPFWAKHTLDPVHGGFVGQIDHFGTPQPEAPKGVVLNARILWTFSAAHRLLEGDAYRQEADRAFVYLITHGWDPENEGVFWSLDYRGEPLDTRKQTYAQAFAIYGLTEYHRATGSVEALQRAIRLFGLMEAHTFDRQHGGYIEAFRRDWSVLEDMRLSDKDLNAPKSMNTLLHVLEAYTNLLRVWPNAALRQQLTALTERFLDTVIDPETYHLRLFFDKDWSLMSGLISYGHDIEAAWLLLDAAEVLGDPVLYARVREAAIGIARTTLREGLDADGGLFYEFEDTLDSDKHWWPQAEAVVGFLVAYQETGDAAFLDAAVAAWDFTKRCILDLENGEWFGRVNRAGVPYEDEDKVGFWKCPYHNARVCFEVMARLRSDTMPVTIPTK